MLTSRNYIVTDATLAGLVQRNAKTMSFYSLIVEVTRRLIAFDAKATEITFYNMNGEHGPGGLMEAVHDMMSRHLAPGPALDSITTTQMQHTGGMLNTEIPAHSNTIDVNLYAWLRHIFSLCNAQAIYGPDNIFAMHPDLEREFWDFEDGMLGLVVDVVPWITARKAFMARKRVLNGLVEYVEKEHYKKASPLIQERVQTNLDYGISKEMSGHAELILMFGILGNAVPSNFWLVANIFSRPELLRQIRMEVQIALDIKLPSPPASPVPGDPRAQSTETYTISSKAIDARSCPLLYACYRETLRDISLLTSARLVLEDTLLADKYLLRKKSVVQIAGGVIHHTSDVWGKDADKFNPQRFLSHHDTEAKDEEPRQQASPLPKGVPSAAFRAFGGGIVICPGRHFAQSELMTLAAVLALGFEIEQTDGTTLQLPEKDDTRIPLAVVKPVLDPKVRVRRRDGWEGVDWEIGL